jgi:hypothetical protein
LPDFSQAIAEAHIKIDISVKDKTTKCNQNFKCLSGDTSCLCKVDDSEKLATVKIKPKPDLSCPYCLSLNAFQYCLCPTRNEIYKKYKK